MSDWQNRKRRKCLSVILMAIMISGIFSSCENADFEYQPDVFITDWLIAGPFPICDDCGTTDYKHGANCTGFYTDFLVSIGGEKDAVPKAGDSVTHPKLKEPVVWFEYRSQTEMIPLNAILSPNDLVVGYAFSTITSPVEQKSILSLGSNDGVQVFLNGEKIHENHPLTGRWLQKDNDYIPVILRAGKNHLLIKVDEGGGDFGFVARFLDYNNTLAEIRKDLQKHQTLTLVAIEDTLVAKFGEPYKISILNPNGKALIEIIHDKIGKIAAFTAAPGEEIRIRSEKIPAGFFLARATFETETDGQIVSEVRHFQGELKRHARAGMLNADLAPVHQNGEPFFPIGTYGAPVEDYAKLKEAGYNFVVASAKNLDQVQAAGLLAAVPLHGSKPHWFDAVRDSIAKYKNHPAVLCWMLYDEPGLNRADLLDIYQIYNIAYETDPYHPSYLVLTMPTVYKTFGRCCDVLSVDTYPVANGDITDVGSNLARAVNASEPEVPVWHCGQLFQWPTQRRPNAKEHRFMTYAALVEGARGVLWYTYKGYGQYLPVDDPQLWQAQIGLLSELNELAPVFIAKQEETKGMLTDDYPDIRFTLKRSRIGNYLIAVNQSKTNTVMPDFQLSKKIQGDIRVHGEDRKIKIDSGKFTDRFEPLDVHIYRLP
ncbi:MAG: hypothetical protein E4H13_09105 [Calditrichales bacterium]|nr:MAG: hypothetical protein E4H13_09105 [Calditrichales bacterium]